MRMFLTRIQIKHRNIAMAISTIWLDLHDIPARPLTTQPYHWRPIAHTLAHSIQIQFGTLPILCYSVLSSVHNQNITAYYLWSCSELAIIWILERWYWVSLGCGLSAAAAYVISNEGCRVSLGKFSVMVWRLFRQYSYCILYLSLCFSFDHLEFLAFGYFLFLLI